MITIALDCGASFLKGAAFAADGTLQRSLQVAAPPVCHGESAEDLLAPRQACALLSAVREMLARLTKGQRRARLCIANEMHGFLLTDARGIPQMDYLSWQRSFGTVSVAGETAVSRLKRRCGEAVRQTGMPLRGSLPSANLLYLARSGILKRMRGELLFCTLGDYILRALSGQAVFTHPTNAAASGLYDLQERVWSKPLLGEVAAGRICFPSVGEAPVSFEVGGVTYEALPAVGDQQAALLGAELRADGQLSFNLGTGAQVSVLTDDFTHEEGVQIRPYFFGKYIRTLPHLPSGRALNVYIRFLQDVLARFGVEADEAKVWQVFLDAADAEEGELFEVDMSFFENPCSKRITGLLAGFSEHRFHLGTLAASILHAMAKNFLWAARAVRKEGDVKEILFSGGVARQIERIRMEVAAGYPTAQVRVAENETLRGLWQYGKQVV